MDSRHLHIGSVVGGEQDWTVVGVARVQDFPAGEAVVPGLSIAVEGSGTVDPYVLSSPDPESDGFLEVVVEVVVLPVTYVVGKL